MTTLENDQLIVTFFGTSESLTGTGQDAPCCGMRHAPVFLWREKQSHPTETWGVCIRMEKSRILLPSVALMCFEGFLTEQPFHVLYMYLLINNFWISKD